MMDKAFWSDFFRWLDSASDGQIDAARAAANANLQRPLDPDQKREIKRMKRMMNEEVIARSDLARLVRRRG